MILICLQMIHCDLILEKSKAFSIHLKRRRQQEHFLILASRLAAQHLNPETPEPSLSVYDWVVSIIRDGPNFDLAADIEMIKAIDYLKNKEFSLAVQTLKSFENKDIKMVGTAATNLSFLYLLEGDVANADKYATISVYCDRYNARALINKGNCQFLKGTSQKDSFKQETLKKQRLATWKL
jgi:hypothetical protein